MRREHGTRGIEKTRKGGMELSLLFIIMHVTLFCHRIAKLREKVQWDGGPVSRMEKLDERGATIERATKEYHF